MATSAEPTNGTRKLTILSRAKRAIQRAIQNRPKPPAPSTAKYPVSPFALWGFEEAGEAISAAVSAQTIDTSRKTTPTKITPAQGDAVWPANRRVQNPLEVNRAFYSGDHWQNGAGYIGPHPANGDAAFSQAMTEISGIFTSQNAIREVTDRHASGLIGKPFRWSFVPRRDIGPAKPSAVEQAAIDEATAMMRNWLTARKVPTLVSNAVATLLLAERAAVRLNVPAGLMVPGEGGTTAVAATSIEEALAKIWPEHPMPEHATVACDDNTKLEAGVFVCEGESDAIGDDRDQTEEYAWLTFLNQAGNTIIRVLDEDDEAEEKVETAAEEAAEDEADVYATRPGDGEFDLGGRIAMFEMHRPALVTPQVQQAQRALNFALTMVPRNVTTGGFVERLIFDASVPGKFEEVNGVKRFVPDKLKLGAGTTNFIEGAEYEVTDKSGEKIKVRGHPSAMFRDPVSPKSSLEAKEAHYESVVAETGQRHVLISGDAISSAISRVQARAEYLNTLLRTKPEVEALLTWLLETALALAEALAKKPGQYTKALRVNVQCKVDTGPITPEERKAVEESIGVTISQDTAMLMLDVDDVDAEKSRMAEDPASRFASGDALGKALQSLTAAGATLEGAAKILKLTPTEIKDLLTPETYAALPGGVSVKQPKPGAPGEVIEPQAALEEPRAASTAAAIDTAPNPATAAAAGAKGAKPSSSPGSTPGSAAAGGAAA